MATLADTYALLKARDSDPPVPLLERVIAAVGIAAVQVLGEAAPQGKPEADAHARRVLWAQSALHDPVGMARRMFVGVAANGVIADAGDEADDGAVQFTVNSLIGAFAGTV